VCGLWLRVKHGDDAVKDRRHDRLGPTSLSLVVLCLLSLPVWSAPSNYAMQMDKAASALFLDIAAAGDRLVAVGERGHILYSNDAGDSWTQTEVPTSAMLTRVFFISDQRGWAVGHDGNVLTSNDGGISWELQRDGVSDQARINEVRAGTAKEQVGTLRDRLLSSEATGRVELMSQLEEAQHTLDEALLDLDTAVYAPPLMDIWFANEQQGWASGAYGTLLHTSNGGRQWQDWSHKVDNADQLHLNGVTGTANGALFLASEWGTIFRSSTAGESWEAIDSGYEGSFFGLVVNPDTNTLFAYGLRGTIYRSTDNGLNWNPLQSKAQDSLFGSHVTQGGQLIFVGSNGTVTWSDDNGESFTPLRQASRYGVYGIAPTTDGHYVLTGENGSRRLIEGTFNTGPKQ